MKLTNRLIKTSILMIFSLYSCSLESVPSQNNNIEKSNLSKDKNFSINGVAQFDSFKVKSDADIATRATISVKYPSGYTNTNLRNSTVATGLTDLQGNFFINFNNNPDEPFIPDPNTVMILEASKRIGGVGYTTILLRTNIKWNGQNWESISSPNIYLNKKTTALSIISDLDPNTMNHSESINKLVYLYGVGNVIFDSKLTVSRYNAVYRAVENMISDLRDPVEGIINIYPYDGTVNYFTSSSSSSIKSNAHTFQTMVETYAVDWGGVYPDSAVNLEMEAKSKRYWKEFKNPFAIYEPIPGYLPTNMSFSEYEQAKNTLSYKGNTLTNKSDFKGIVIYDPVKTNYPIIPITKYFIYGVDYNGDFVKTDDRNENSETFVLTNQ